MLPGANGESSGTLPATLASRARQLPATAVVPLAEIGNAASRPTKTAAGRREYAQSLARGGVALVK
jgi:hypothetical protein